MRCQPYPRIADCMLHGWDTRRSARYNQDHQREVEEAWLDRVVVPQYDTTIKTSYNVGGSYVELEHDWHKQHLQYLQTTRASRARSGRPTSAGKEETVKILYCASQ